MNMMKAMVRMMTRAVGLTNYKVMRLLDYQDMSPRATKLLGY